MSNRDAVLLTGATGYVGGRLAARLASEGRAVHALVRPGRGVALRSGVEGHEDPGTTLGTCRLLERLAPTAVFHLAARGGLRHEAAEVDALLEANVALGARLLEAASRCGGPPFLSAGSWWQLAGPACLYTTSKEMLSLLVEGAAREHGLPALTLLLFDVYGPADPRSKLLGKLAAAARSGEPLAAGSGERRLSPVHVEDVVEAFLHAARLLEESVELSGRRFAVRSPDAASPRELAALLAELSGRPVPVDWGARPDRPGEPEAPPPAPLLPGWSARRGLREGLAELVAEW